MSKTLFWYLLRELVKIFVMTSGVLAGIMSFGGLFKPLMQYGLNATQVVQMLSYMMPATMTYSLPIAALFATTVVYGRLAADNELTACRASGISYMALAVPALVLGLLLSVVSLVGLSFIVPAYSLKVEKVAFSSMADFVHKSIQRTHQIKLRSHVIFAESAEVQKMEGGDPNEEVVILHNPMFCSYEKMDVEGDDALVPDVFYTARRAVVVIRRGEDEVQFTAELEDGSSFPRDFRKGSAGGVGVADFGPVPVPSPLRENAKFMDIKQLKKLAADPTKGRKVREYYIQITRLEQEHEMLARIAVALRRQGQFRFESGEEIYTLSVEPGVRVPARPRDRLMLASEGGPEARQIRIVRARRGQVLSTYIAQGLELRIQSDTTNDRMRLAFEMENVVMEVGEGRPGRPAYSHTAAMATPADLREYEKRGAEYYLTHAHRGAEEFRLRDEILELRREIESELHARASFGVSCFILVVAGCALGMMFRTGNFLSAFALSVIPALISIALIVTGQHVGEAAESNLKMGLGIIWSGNVLVCGLAIGLFGHLRKL